MIIWVRVLDTRRVSDLIGTGKRMIFYPRMSHIPDLNQDGYETGIFSPADTRYFTAVIILDCEQIKMRSFYYINYDLLIVELCYFIILNIC
jgi:hypothetical protein